MRRTTITRVPIFAVRRNDTATDRRRASAAREEAGSLLRSRTPPALRSVRRTGVIRFATRPLDAVPLSVTEQAASQAMLAAIRPLTPYWRARAASVARGARVERTVVAPTS